MLVAPRVAAAGAVAAVLFALRAAVPEPVERGMAIYLLVVSLGYGHLIGGALFARRSERPRGSRIASGGLVAATLLSGFGVYIAAVAAAPVLALPLLALSIWHAVENDLALTPEGARPIAPLPLGWGHHASSLGLSIALAALFVAAIPAEVLSSRPALPIDLSGWIRFEEIFGAWTLYHLVSWLAVAVARARQSGRPLTGLVAVHALPGVVCAGLLYLPLDWSHPLRQLVFAPAAYLYWAAAHVVQTHWARRPPPRASRQAHSLRSEAS